MPAVIDLPKRQRSGAFQFTEDERNETLTLLSEAKTGQAVSVTDEFKVADYKAKGKLTAEQVARNVASGRNNVIKEALEPHIDDDYHIRMHVVSTGNGYVGAVSLRKGPKPDRKPRVKKSAK